MTRLIRLSIRNLSGVPSIVYGLFGVILFVNVMRFGTSILSAGLTLGLLTLPWTITASEEALKTVPNSYREGALALGATKWQTIRTNVLPYAIPGMLTGTVLGLARAAGETAPILFTGAAFFLPYLPEVPGRPVHGPAVPSLHHGHPASRHRSGPALGLRDGPRPDRPRPGHEHGRRRHPVPTAKESSDERAITCRSMIEATGPRTSFTGQAGPEDSQSSSVYENRR